MHVAQKLCVGRDKDHLIYPSRIFTLASLFIFSNDPKTRIFNVSSFRQFLHKNFTIFSETHERVSILRALLSSNLTTGRLFDTYPETRAKFPRLNVTSPEVMRKSARVKAHGGRVVTSLGGIIQQLNEMDLVDETIFLLGDSHHKRGVTTVDFEVSSAVTGASVVIRSFEEAASA